MLRLIKALWPVLLLLAFVGRIAGGVSQATEDIREGGHVKEFIGIIKDGKFRQLEPHSGQTNRLTSIPIFAAMPPENAEINLTEYENQQVVVVGQEQGEWIFSAELKSLPKKDEAPGN